MRPDLSQLRARLRLPFWHKADIEDEIASHVQDVENEIRAQGTDQAEARRAAVERLGGLDSLGDSLQAVHQGWIGGATVQRRFAKFVFGLVTACAVSALWLYMFVGNTMLRPPPPFFTAAKYDRLQRRAWEVKSQPAEFRHILLGWRKTSPRVTWMGIIDKSGMLLWSQPRLRDLKGPLPNADRIQPTFCSDGTVGVPEGGRWQRFYSLSPMLVSAGAKVEWFQFVALGGDSKQTYIGSAVIALGPPLWREWVTLALTSVWFWYGLVWLASAAAIALHRRPSDGARAWLWGGMSLLLGPLIWLGYPVLVTLGRIPQAEGAASLRSLALVPVAGLAFTLLLVGHSVGAPRVGVAYTTKEMRVIPGTHYRQDYFIMRHRRPAAWPISPSGFHCPPEGQ